MEENNEHRSIPFPTRQETRLELIEVTRKTHRGQMYYTSHQSLPNLETAFSQFEKMYPQYTSQTLSMESLRSREYSHLLESGRVCFDYCGFGLFTYRQQMEEWESSSFSLATMQVNLYSQMLLGAPKDGTLEYSVRSRIMKYLNIEETEYNMVFTASRGASFGLLADAYPFASYRRLITMYDYESESVGWLVQRAKEKGAKVYDLSFKWPSLRVASTQLRKLLIAKRKRRRKGSMNGLFVFPVQSRVSGSKYSYQWMSLAQQNKWHVLLDASALGPKDMDSLGLSLFKPDFIIASFYKVFGADPSGFGCFFVKNTAISSVRSQLGHVAPGIVKIIPPPFEVSSSGSSYRDNDIIDDGDGSVDEEDSRNASIDFEFPKNPNLAPMVASFSGPVLGFDSLCSFENKSVQTQVKKERKQQGDDDGNHDGEEYDDDDSFACDSNGEVVQSPVFSEEGAENLRVDNISSSPMEYACHTLMSSGDQFSSPFKSEPLCVSILGEMNVPESGALRIPLFEDKCLENETMKQESTQREALNDVDSASATSGTNHFSPESSSEMIMKNPDDESFKVNNNIQEKGRFLSNMLEQDVDTIRTCNEKERADAELEVVSFGHKINENGQKLLEEIQKTEEIDFFLKSQSGICHEIEENDRRVGKSLSPFRENPKKTRHFDAAQHMGQLHLDSQSGDEYEATRIEEDDNDEDDDDDDDDTYEWEHHKVVCKSLDHADMLGLNKATLRLRCLINWLIDSLLQLRHDCSHSSEKSQSLIHIYGPRVKYNRGASVAFNIYDSQGRLVHPELVQMLADKNNISLSIGFLRNIQLPDKEMIVKASVDEKKVLKGLEIEKVQARVEVVTAALSFLSTFEDVYKLWVFASRFLDAHYVSKQLGGHKVESLHHLRSQ